jgi:cyclopropane fatty-acyl-phospholipid synthase-like methyltransferase
MPFQESMPAMALRHSDYVLGYNDREQLRLIRQARILAPLTESFLRSAGIVSGMRVLDIGCGMGDVTMLAAHLVGRGEFGWPIRRTCHCEARSPRLSIRHLSPVA